MTEWTPSLFRSWFVVAQARQLKTKPLSVTLLDRPLVITRLQSGVLLALDERVGSVQVCEHDGLIWLKADVSENDVENVGVLDLPIFLRRLTAESRRFMWSTTWNAPAIDALENFLDPMHTHFVHPGLVRSHGARRPVTATIRRSGGVLQVDYQGQQQQSGWLYRLFESPRELERAHFAAAAAGSAQLEYRYQNGSVLYFTIHFSPVSEALTLVHGTLHVEGRWAPRWAVQTLAWPFLRHVARQDQKIVETQAMNKARFRRGGGVSTELDLVRPSLDEVWSVRGHSRQEESRSVQIWL